MKHVTKILPPPTTPSRKSPVPPLRPPPALFTVRIVLYLRNQINPTVKPLFGDKKISVSVQHNFFILKIHSSYISLLRIKPKIE